MNNLELAKYVNSLEGSYPVDRWTVNGIRVWPLIRNEMYFDFLQANFSNSSGASKAPRINEKVRMVWNILKTVFGSAKASLSDRAKNATVEKTDALFLAGTNEALELNGEWYNRNSDPLIDRLKTSGKTSLILMPGFPCRTPRYNESCFIQPQLEAAFLRAKLFGKPTSSNGDWLERHEEFIADLGRHGLQTSGFSIAELRKKILLIDCYARYFESIIEKTKPRIGVTVSFHYNVGMAFILACRRRGVPICDIQHGTQGDLVLPFGFWANVPRDGFELLPNYFLCHRDYDVASLARWCNGSNSHQAIAIGNLMLEDWVGGSNKLTEYYDEFIAEKMGGNKSRLNVLVTLQPIFHLESDMAPFLRAVSACGDKVNLWVRMHPRMSVAQRQAVGESIRKHGITNYDVENATAIPLYALLRNTALHVTHSSYVTVEAVQFGVKSLLLSTYGRDLFADSLEKTWMDCAETEPDIRGIILRGIQENGGRLKSSAGISEGLEKVLNIINGTPK